MANPFLAIQDTRWSGKARYGPYMLIPITILLFLYTIFIVVALVYSAARPYATRTYHSKSGTWSYRDRNTPLIWDKGSSQAA